jgi:acetyl-CoA synthetase
MDALLQEDRRFPPPPAFQAEAHARSEDVYDRAEEDFEAWWEGWARELHWFREWDRVLEWDPPHAKWFQGGTLNVSYNCLDRHLDGPRRNKAALIWEGEPGDVRVMTYYGLHRRVAKFAHVLRNLGVERGDRVAIYLPMVPEAAIAMLACTRIGAVHSVVFGGFSPESLADRINAAGAKVLITADGGHRRGTLVPLKNNADEAMERASTIEHCVVVARDTHIARELDVRMKPGRDLWYHELMRDIEGGVDAVPMEAEDTLFILYTSGTTGKPKGVVHTTGGYLTQAYATTKWVFDLKEDDRYWCTADVGWITGHSYIVYGPLANGATVFMFEGAPDWPNRGRFWHLCEKYGITVFYTAPTAIRAFMRWGEAWPEKYDLSQLRLLGTVGEPINPEAWMWYHEVIGKERCPIVDTWWQTETGGIMITPLPGVTSTKPGTATRPFPGIQVDIRNDEGDSVHAGYLAVTRPWPSMLRGVWGDEERFRQTYWSKWENTYFPGDGAHRDEDENEFIWILGRVDDVLNTAGHRIGTMEVESALVDDNRVAEAAVVGKHHEVKGESIAAFVTLKEGIDGSDALADELKAHVAKKIGAIARPELILFTADLPKTRSGKIMRRLLRDIAEGRAMGEPHGEVRGGGGLAGASDPGPAGGARHLPGPRLQPLRDQGMGDESASGLVLESFEHLGVGAEAGEAHGDHQDPVAGLAPHLDELADPGLLDFAVLGPVLAEGGHHDAPEGRKRGVGRHRLHGAEDLAVLRLLAHPVRQEEYALTAGGAAQLESPLHRDLVALGGPEDPRVVRGDLHRMGDGERIGRRAITAVVAVTGPAMTSAVSSTVPVVPTLGARTVVHDDEVGRSLVAEAEEVVGLLAKRLPGQEHPHHRNALDPRRGERVQAGRQGDRVGHSEGQCRGHLAAERCHGVRHRGVPLLRSSVGHDEHADLRAVRVRRGYRRRGLLQGLRRDRWYGRQSEGEDQGKGGCTAVCPVAGRCGTGCDAGKRAREGREHIDMRLRVSINCASSLTTPRWGIKGFADPGRGRRSEAAPRRPTRLRQGVRGCLAGLTLGLVPDLPGGGADVDRVGPRVLGHGGVGAHQRVLSHGHAGQNGGVVRQPHPLLDDGLRCRHLAGVHQVVRVTVDIHEIGHRAPGSEADPTPVVQQDVPVDHDIIPHVQVVSEGDLHVMEDLHVVPAGSENPLGQGPPEQNPEVDVLSHGALVEHLP